MVVHVLWNTPAENVSDAQIQSQIDALNRDFSGTNADKANIPAIFQGLDAHNINVLFQLACIDPQGNPTNGIIRKNANKTFQYERDPITKIVDEQATGIKFSSTGGSDGWAANQYLNIWVCNLVNANPYGYAQFPHELSTKFATDGVVLHTNVFGTFASNGGFLFPNLRLGRTATHEVGHWLGLRHIWGDAECGDDFVADTPTQMQQNLACPTHPKISTCPVSGTNNGDMFMNYMDYTYDNCKFMFTQEQKLRMRANFAQGGVRESFMGLQIQSASNGLVCSAGSTFFVSPEEGGSNFTWSFRSNLARFIDHNGNQTSTMQGTNSVQVVFPTSNGWLPTDVLQVGSNGFCSAIPISSGELYNGCGDDSPIILTEDNRVIESSQKGIYRICPGLLLKARYNICDGIMDTPNLHFKWFLNGVLLQQGYNVTEVEFISPPPSSYYAYSLIVLEISSTCDDTPLIYSNPIYVSSCGDFLPTITAYPNPVSNGMMNVDLPDVSGDVVIRLLDAFGVVRKTFLGKAAGQTLSFDVANLPHGIYFLQVVGGNFNQTTKIIIGGTVAN